MPDPSRLIAVVEPIVEQAGAELVDLEVAGSHGRPVVLHLTDADLERVVQMPRRAGQVQTDAAAHVLAHLFMHQTHHRGQAHTMPSSTAVAPPQLDEFLMPSAAPLRRAEMAAQGWQETLIYGP